MTSAPAAEEPAALAAETSAAPAKAEPNAEGQAKATPAAPSEGDAPVEETRNAVVIQETFKANRPKARACFDESVKKHPGLRGNLTITFVIDPKGKVKQASINTARSDLNVAELNACVIDAVMQIVFPPSSRGFESQGNYPFNFNP